MSKTVKLFFIANVLLLSSASWLAGMEPTTDPELLTNSSGTGQSEEVPGEIGELAVLREQIEAFSRLSPTRFNWIDDELTRPVTPGLHPRVGGMACPRSVGEIKDLKMLGIRLFVTLTEEPWHADLITELGPVVVIKYAPAEVVAQLPPATLPEEIAQAQLTKIAELNLIAIRALADGLCVYLHLPVADATGMTQIAKEQVALFIQVAGVAIQLHHSVVAHCQQGINRTGLLLIIG